MGSAMSTRPTSRLAALLRGWLGVSLVPLAVLVDTALAVRHGWAANSAGVLSAVPKLMAAWLAIVAALALVREFRGFLVRHSARLMALGLALLAGCCLLEMSLYAVRPVAPFHLRPPGAVYQFDPDANVLPGVFGKAQSTINSQGVRGPELPADRIAYRVLCVGGSGAECYYLDDAEAWPAVLGEKLSAQGPRLVWTGAAAVSQHGLAQHARFVAESPLVAEMDCLVVLAGVNDLLQCLLGLDAQRDLPGPLWYRSQLIDLAQETWNARLGMGLVIDADGSRIALARLGRQIPERKLNERQLLDDYEQRLRQLVAAADARHVRLVLVTQPVLWDDFLSATALRRLRWARVYPYPRPWDKLKPGPLRAWADRYNERLRQVAQACGVPCVDAASGMNGVEMYFYDDFHLNEAGCQALGQRLAEAIAVPSAEGG